MPEETENYIRIPVRKKEYSKIRTTTISKEQGIKALIGITSKGSEIKTYLFEKNKWTMTKARTWIAEHSKEKIADMILITALEEISKKNVKTMRDSIVVDQWKETEDSLILTNVVFAKEIVQDYPDGKHYKPAEELKKALDSFRGKPVVPWAHPKQKVVTSLDQQIGHIVFDSVKWDPFNSRAYGDVLIQKKHENPEKNRTAKELITAIKTKSLEDNSIGFHCNVIKESGEFNGTPYDYKQENIFVDHLALVYRGRASSKDGVGINAY